MSTEALLSPYHCESSQMRQEMFLHRFRIAKPYQRSLCEVIRCTILCRRQQTALLYALKLNYVKSSRVIQMWVSRVLEPQYESTAQTVSGCSPYSKWRPPQGKEAPCFITILPPFGKLFFPFSSTYLFFDITTQVLTFLLESQVKIWIVI